MINIYQIVEQQWVDLSAIIGVTNIKYSPVIQFETNRILCGYYFNIICRLMQNPILVYEQSDAFRRSRKDFDPLIEQKIYKWHSDLIRAWEVIDK